MGFLDNRGLARFTAWVQERLAGKQDKLTPDGSLTVQGGGIGLTLPTKAVTKAEYDALTEAEKQADVLYLVSGPGASGSSGAVPIGAVIPFMALSAPEGYLICDGAVHNISDYPELAAFFADQFGTTNHFGGDGTSTFAVPDMRNLFLRGYHGEAEEPLSGEIGEKQEATRVPEVGTTGDGGIYFPSGNNITPQHCDEKAVDTIRSFIGTKSQGSLPASSYITIRPVNMAVLYCVKAV